MGIVLDKTTKKNDPSNIVLILEDQMKRNASSDNIIWLMLGGKEFMQSRPSSGMDYITASSKGIPKLSLINLAAILDVPMKDIATLLNVSYKTLGRKKRTDKLDTISSSLSVEIANTIAKGLSVFEDSAKLNRWLHKENRALKSQKPFDLLSTPTGIKLVNQVLGRIEEGVYT